MSRKSCFGRLAVKTASLLLIVCTISLLSSCGGGGSSSTTSGSGPNVPPPPTASLTLLQVTPGNASVAASSTQQFSETGKYSDGTRDLGFIFDGSCHCGREWLGYGSRGRLDEHFRYSGQH